MEKEGFHEISFWVLGLGYEWIAVLFLFITAYICLDLYILILFLFRRIAPTVRLPASPGKRAFCLATTAALAALIYGHFEARAVVVNRVEPGSSGLASTVSRLRVVQVTDLHFSAVNGPESAKRVADRIRELKPDLLVATGDLLDMGIRDTEKIARILRGIEAPLGKYAVTGNHEFYYGLHQAIAFLDRSGFRVLRGEAAHPVPGVTVIGVDDEAAHRFSGPAGTPLHTLLRQVPEKDTVIILRHRPIIDEGTAGRFDLQLSGHTHGGQIFPFGWIVARVYPFFKGTYLLGERSRLHVSRGTGTWGPPVRLLAPPEITVIDYCRP
jgi:predicted MPP superfamily phosphohydrolase